VETGVQRGARTSRLRRDRFRASTNSTSPPVGVTARPVATPGTAVRAADSWKNFGRRNALTHGGIVDGNRRRGGAGGDAPRRLPQQRAELARPVARITLGS
jgi:hypothetical protein